MFWRNLLTPAARWQKCKDGNSRFLQNTVPNNMASHIRRQLLNVHHCGKLKIYKGGYYHLL